MKHQSGCAWFIQVRVCPKDQFKEKWTAVNLTIPISLSFTMKEMTAADAAWREFL